MDDMPLKPSSPAQRNTELVCAKANTPAPQLAQPPPLGGAAGIECIPAAQLAQPPAAGCGGTLGPPPQLEQPPPDGEGIMFGAPPPQPPHVPDIGITPIAGCGIPCQS